MDADALKVAQESNRRPGEEHVEAGESTRGMWCGIKE